MGLETGTFITDLTTTNPISTDVRSQGDDHLRLLKTCVKGSFPTASKAWYNPNSVSKSISFSVVAADMNKLFICDTSAGAISMTLPTLVGGDGGWECFMMKATTDVNSVRILPPSGTLQSGAVLSLSSARRAIPWNKITCLWTGSSWVISRCNGVPVGSVLEFHGNLLPVGYEWPNGQVFASAGTFYPEYNSVVGSGSTLDKRGRIGVALDNLGTSAANRITTAGGGVDGVTFSAAGGLQNVVLVAGNLPSYTPSGSVAVTDGPISVSQNAGANGGSTTGGGGFSCAAGAATITASQTGTTAVFTGNNNGGISTAVKTLPPMIMVREILVVE